jgi:hypothetical protein
MRHMAADWEAHSSSWRTEENSILAQAGFEPTEEDALWRRQGVWYGREAALQTALREGDGSS